MTAQAHARPPNTESPGRRCAGAARGPREMGAPGGEAAAAGPARFQCPEEFCARHFAPGAALCAESLAAPGTRLLLIRGPADFRPESLDGRSLTLLGSRLLRAPQPDGSQRVYSLHGSREESGARLLVAAGRPDGLACAQPFSGCLRIQERYGEPGAARPLFPVAERPAPRVPGGLKQRFLPFGARLRDARPPSEAAGGAARKRGKKRPLLPVAQGLWRPEGPEPLLGGSTEPAEGLLREPASAGNKRRLLKAEEAEATEPATLPAFGGRPTGPLEEGAWPGREEEPERRRGRKKEKKRKSNRETEGSPDPNSRSWRPERDPCLPRGSREPEGGLGDCGGGEPALGGCKAKKRRKSTQGAGAEGLWGIPAIKEEPVDVSCLGSPLEEGLGAVGEDPAGELHSCKKKKKRSREKGAEGLWGVLAIKEEPGDVPCLGSLLGEGLGSPREEPGREFPGYIKQSPGKGAEGLWGITALKEELGDVPSLGSLAEESLGAITEDPAEELFSCKKKKKKKKSRERVAEELWAVSALKEEPEDIGCLGSLPEGGLGSARGGPAGELLACKKKKKGKMDKEPLQEQGTETQQLLESTVQDWAVPLGNVHIAK
ncbi:DNA-directed RNA polymerase I subunit RPA34 [Protobothrops mucrosquamatus]|uniref:DNA-directed RNA polymerase I subunit RPA34 n=1 Tax=Protobothrops mucrosquamatus TaxID=103944 RepID=UPI000775806F|nr:DNA-directed RNA polymerase I subunit RPA34 [Protobothrops mucrosquamatus]